MSEKFNSTVIGAAAGFFMSGSIVGGIIGGVLGKMYDTSAGTTAAPPPGRLKNPHIKELVFVTNITTLMTSVAKADLKIPPAEAAVIKQYITRTFRYTGTDEYVIGRIIREAAKRKLNLRAITEETKRLFDYPERLLLLRVLYGIASSNKTISDAEHRRIQEIADYLEISSADQSYVKREFGIEYDASDYYAVLEITPTVSDEEVKTAYREMVKKYHPDRVAHLGKEFADLAHKKFQYIQEAYQAIVRERKIEV